MELVKPSGKNSAGVVIGTYSGKSCDADVLNNNAMYLSRELFDKLINSEEYETAIKLGWYIGYLGHPKDPNCMDFRNACIVMREMHMDDNGDVFATFDLLDTPVGKIVKTFIDAGVQFGISIRGAGDVANDGTVDPNTFVFRGYDLVTFPAYDDAIPEYMDVAAASDINIQQKYKKIRSAITTNLKGITSCEAIEVIQQHLNPVSEEFAALADREAELAGQDCEVDKDEYITILEQKLEGMTNLYLKQYEANSALTEEIDTVTSNLMDARYAVTSTSQINSRKAASIQRIFKDQVRTISAALEVEQHRNSILKKTNARLKTSILASKQSEEKLVEVNKKLSTENQRITAALEKSKDSLDKNNLIYRRKIESSTETLQRNESTISELREDLRKTVAEKSRIESALSNRDNEVEKLQQSVAASSKMILQYQQSYADLCADIVGVHVDNIDVTASTTPDQLKQMIFGSTGYRASVNPVQPEPVEFETDFDDDEVVTL